MATESSSPARRGRPPSPEKRAAILRAATDAFLRDGYTGTNLDDVAATAGVSKQTVYRNFADKKSLFIAVVDAARADAPSPVPTGPQLDPADLPGSLIRLGEAVLAVTLSDQVAALRRVMIGELTRIPALRARWSAGAPIHLATQLAADLTDLNATGTLTIPDVPQALSQLLALISFPAMLHTAYGVTPLTAPERTWFARSAADMFLRAYGR